LRRGKKWKRERQQQERAEGEWDLDQQAHLLPPYVQV
jgi:hypothetical protein